MVEGDPTEEAVERRATVLVVEDEVLLRLAIAEELRFKKFVVIEAATADEAIAVLQSATDIDLLLTDIRMPGRVDGLGLVRMARAENPGCKVVVVSGHLPATAIAESVDAFFAKPYDFSALVDRVELLLATER